MNWEKPDWQKLYHQLLYEVKPHYILDKRTHQEAHEQTIEEAQYLKRVHEDWYEREVEQYGSTSTLNRADLLRQKPPEEKT